MKGLRWIVIATAAASILACRQAPPPAPKAAPEPGKVLTAEEMERIEQERELKQGGRPPDYGKMNRDAMRIQEKGAARAEKERERLRAEAEKAEAGK